MARVISGFRRVSIFDPATGDTVQLNRISTEGSEFTQTPLPTENTQGQTFAGYESEMIVAFTESDGLTQLETWMKNYTPVQVVVEGAMEFHLWQESVDIEFIRGLGPNARDGVNIHQIGFRHVGKSSPNIYQAVNLISAGSVAFELFNDGNDNPYEFIFPIEGAAITAAADYANYDGNTTLTIIFFDFNGSSLGSVGELVTANGRFSNTQTAPARTYKVRVQFDGVDDFVGGDITNRTIRLGTDSDYVGY